MNDKKAESHETVEEFKFDDLPPIKGFPELRWAGKRPFRSTHYFPAQKKESYGEPVDGWMNRIYWGDNLQVMSHLLKEFRGKIDLIYIDPPFDSKANYTKKIRLRGVAVKGEYSSFEEKQYSDIWLNDGYLQYMQDRLVLCRELLGDEGSLYVHCDYQRSHYLKLILDEVFGQKNFRSEIVWRRTTARSEGVDYNHIHDTIFFYSKSDNFAWNVQHTPYSKEYLSSNFKEDDNGRLFRESPITAPGTRRGLSGAEWKGLNPSSIGKGRHWSIPAYLKKYLSAEAENNTLNALNELDKIGRIVWAKEGKGRPNAIQYADEMSGVELQSLWTDFTALSGNAAESEDYPTQKPEKLLERIIRSSTREGQIVFDGFMGSGTTQAVAMKLGRRFIGADINLGAIETTTKRLNSIRSGEQQDELKLDKTTTLFSGFEVLNVNNYDIFRNPIQAKEVLKEALELQPLERNAVFDGIKDSFMVKIMPVNRIATRQDLNELITGIDYKSFERRRSENPNNPVERIELVCMGHEPDLAATLQEQMKPYDVEVRVVDVLRDKTHLEFKRSAEAKVVIEDGKLIVENFFPMNLLQKLSVEEVDDWRQLVESIKIDWNYDGAVLEPAIIESPEGNDLVSGSYDVPDEAGIIRIKITDLLSESLELNVESDE